MEIAVFAGGSTGNSTAFERAAGRFGRDLAEHSIGLVYGGGRVGLMGALANGALSVGGRVTGVMPSALVEAEIAHPGLTELTIVRTMHERKQAMAELADAFVALPGGAGTLEELFEAWTWQQLGLHSKPVALLDVDGFWSPLLAALDTMVAAGFVRDADRRSLLVVRDAAELIAAAASWTPPPRKWNDGEDRAILESVGWLCVRDGRLLAVRTHGRTLFYLPGGKPESGETARDALVREVAEETGVVVSPDDLTEAFVVEDQADGQPDLRLRMTCFTGSGAGEPEPGREIAEIAWISPRDARRCAPALRQVLRRLAPGLDGRSAHPASDRADRADLDRPDLDRAADVPHSR